MSLTMMVCGNRKREVRAAALFAGLLALILGAAVRKEAQANHWRFWKAATYFADEWVMNFWNSEMDAIDDDFTQIKADGFNSIILVIPWHEFQPQTDPVTYNQNAFSKLSWVMDKADQHGLDVIVRVGYTYDFYNDKQDSAIGQRYYRYFTDVQIQEAWKDYLKELDAALAGHGSYQGAFITWEDWWGSVNYAQALGGKCAESIQMANESGYQDYMSEKYSVPELRQIFQDEAISGKEDIYIPSALSKGFSTFYDFYDGFLNSLLASSQQVIPNLSMEVRADQDLVYDEGQNAGYYSHKSTFSCQGSSYVTAVYGIPMGFENHGEKVTAEEALEKMDYILDGIHQATNHKDLFLDQFLFYDNAPRFQHNAQLKTGEVNSYLEKAAQVLCEKTVGYGIWTYRDYDSNILYNPQFALGEEGWDITGEAGIIHDGSNKLMLKKGSCLSQAVNSARMHYPSDDATVEFDVELMDQKEASLTVRVGSQAQSVSVTQSERVVKKIGDPGDWNLSILTDADIAIDNVKLYTHTQEGLLYDSRGNQGECLAGMRRLNAMVEERLMSGQGQEGQPGQ